MLPSIAFVTKSCKYQGVNKIVCLSWNLIRIKKIRLFYSLSLFYIGKIFLGKNFNIILLIWTLVRRLIWICRIWWWCSLFLFIGKFSLGGKFGPKYQNCLFKLRFGLESQNNLFKVKFDTNTDSYELNSVVDFTFSVLDWE